MYQIDYAQTGASHDRYARCIEASRRIRWDIEKDVFRGREFDFSENFLPPGVSKIQDLGCLTRSETRTLSQIQGRTYANMFGLVEDIQMDSGTVYAPTEPGLGYEIDWDLVKREHTATLE